MTIITFKLSIHNLPYFLLGIMFIFLCAYGSIISPYSYFIVAGIFSLLYFVIESIGLPGLKKSTINQKILITFIISMFWIYFLSYCIFYTLNADKINEKFKHRSHSE